MAYTTQFSEKRILTTHAGALPRPDNLKPLIAARAAGKKVDMKKLDKVLSSSIKGVVKKQIECGIDSLRQAIDGDDHRSIRSAIDRLNKLTDEFAARRMDRSIQRALTGRTIASL